MKHIVDLDALGIGMANPAMFENRAYADGWNSLVTILHQAPVVDAEPVRHGRWKYLFDPPHTWTVHYSCKIACSNCKREFSRLEGVNFNYCPNCGAKMDGGKDDLL